MKWWLFLPSSEHCSTKYHLLVLCILGNTESPWFRNRLPCWPYNAFTSECLLNVTAVAVQQFQITWLTKATYVWNFYIGQPGVLQNLCKTAWRSTAERWHITTASILLCCGICSEAGIVPSSFDLYLKRLFCFMTVSWRKLKERKHNWSRQLF